MQKITGLLMFLFCYILLMPGCLEGGKSFIPSIPGYNGDELKQVVLEKELLEISGVYYMDNGLIASVNDEEGKIYFVNTATGGSTEHHFGKKRDYEDIVQVGDYFYVLESNGNIHRVPTNEEQVEDEFEFKLEKNVEFETLYYDPAVQKLVLVTKNQREIKDAILAYVFDPLTTEFADQPYYTIDLVAVQKKMKNITAEFKPSAAAIHPLLNKLFIIASIGKVLVQCSLDGTVEKVYSMNPVQFPQPEGITFAPNGDMYISNEGVNGKGTILVFPWHK